MSTAADVIIQLDQFIDDVNALLADNTIDAVVDLITSLGGGNVVHEVVTEFSNILKQLHGSLTELIDTIEDPLRHAQALSGLLGLLQPLMTGLGRLVDTSAEQLADAGLDDAMTISEPITQAVTFGTDVLEVGEGVLDMLPSPQTLRELEQSFGALITTVDSYATATANP